MNQALHMKFLAFERILSAENSLLNVEPLRVVPHSDGELFLGGTDVKVERRAARHRTGVGLSLSNRFFGFLVEWMLLWIQTRLFPIILGHEPGLDERANIFCLPFDIA